LVFDGDSAKNIARKISFPRLTGSEGEEEAKNIIIKLLNDYGYTPEVESFVFSLFPPEVLLKIIQFLIGSLAGGAILLFNNTPAFSIVSSFFVIIIIIIGTGWSSLIEKFYDVKIAMRRSQNIMAEMIVKKGLSEIIFLAHYDSKSQTFPIIMRIFFNVTGILFVIISIVSVWIFFVTGAKIPEWFSFLCGMLSFIPFFLLLFNFTRNLSPGALDNASGVGVVLELARCLKGWQGGANIRFLLTGAEELGLAGAIRFIQKYEKILNKDNTYFINFDGISSGGNPVITVRYGILYKKTSQRLFQVIKDVFNKAGIRVRSSWLLIGAGLDSIPIASRGYESVTVSCGGMKKMGKIVHSPYDTSENLSAEALKLVGDAMITLVHEISRENAV
jgi:hypothetical protein